MTKTLATAGAAILATAGAEAQTKWNFDASHTKVEFTVQHLLISEVTGNFKIFDGSVLSPSEDFTNSDIQFSVDIASINTDNTDRDNHLKSDDFFNAEKFPKMIFKSTSFTKVSGNKYQLNGNLTIRDITKPVTFDVVYNGIANDPWGNTKAGFKLRGEISRFDYNLKWNALTEIGGAVVGETVEIVAKVELDKAK
jgi:polyisoprenoid-binding protein YceI